MDASENEDRTSNPGDGTQLPADGGDGREQPGNQTPAEPEAETSNLPAQDSSAPAVTPFDEMPDDDAEPEAAAEESAAASGAEKLRVVAVANDPSFFSRAAPQSAREDESPKRKGRPSKGGARAVREYRKKFPKESAEWMALAGVETMAEATERVRRIREAVAAAAADAEPETAAAPPAESGPALPPVEKPTPAAPPLPKIRGVPVNQVHAWAGPARLVAGTLAQMFDFAGQQQELTLWAGTPFELKTGGNAEIRLTEDLAVFAAERWPLLPSGDEKAREVSATKALVATAAAIAAPKLLPMVAPAAGWAFEKAKEIGGRVAAKVKQKIEQRKRAA